MKRLICLVLCLIVLLSVPCLALEAAPADALTLSAPSAVLMHTDGTVLYEKDAHRPMPPASVTKVMTLLLAAEAIDAGALAMADVVTASAHACSMGGSQVWLEEGEQLTVEQLLKCVVLASANDCAVALAEAVAGSEEAFVTRMNDRAKQLGMENTKFVNCCGLDAQGHLTTAYDIALMSRELMRHSWIEDYTTLWQDTIRDGAFTLTNTNKMVRHYDGMIGLKTGSTSQAGFCLSAVARRDGMTLVAVVLGAENSTKRTADIRTLLDYGFANYCEIPIVPSDPLPQLDVRMGTKKTVPLMLGETAGLLAEKSNAGTLVTHLDLAANLQAPIERGEQVGTLSVMDGDTVLRQIPVVAAEDCPRQTVGRIFLRLLSWLGMRKK
ncbi:MAG: D-alanyl-D-alanine carboxypeptidase [Clostridia bacterium]|nr:D-alanyl-D-alanine carboxypeptidase [Clostridia bacterium]